MSARTVVVGALGIALLGLGAVSASAQKPAGVIDTVDAEWSGVQTELLEVRRMSDNTIRVRWRWRNTGDKEVALYAADAADLLRTETYLLDPANKKKHFVVTDAGGRPIGTDIGMSFRVKPKESYSAWAKFPAPPAGVEKITVVIAKTPPFEDVAIGK
jgi:hypothetical protein